MKVIVKPGMEFQHKDYNEVLKGNKFVVQAYDYYGDDEEILCADDGFCIYPLDGILLNHYMPKVDGVWINEDNEFIY